MRDCMFFQDTNQAVEHIKQDLSYAAGLGAPTDEVTIVLETDVGLVDSSGNLHKERESDSTLAQCITVTNLLAVLENSLEIETFAGVNYLKNIIAKFPT